MSESSDGRAAAELVRGAFDVWAAGTGTVFDVLADDVSWTITGTGRLAGTYRSRQAFLDDTKRRFRTS